MLSFMVSTVALVLIPVGLIWVREAKYPSSLSFSKTSVMGGDLVFNTLQILWRS